MQTANDDADIERFYDDLFKYAANVVTQDGTLPPVIILLEPTGMTYAGHTVHLNAQERASALMSLARNPQFQAAALVAESWYADARHEGADADQFLKLAQQGRLRDYPGRREALVINIVTAARQAVMVCPIDRRAKSVQKAPLQWVDQNAQLIVEGTYIRPTHDRPN